MFILLKGYVTRNNNNNNNNNYQTSIAPISSKIIGLGGASSTEVG